MQFFQTQKRSARQEQLLDTVLNSALVDQVIADAEVDTLGARRELLTQLARLNARTSDEPERRAAACAVIVRRIEETEASLIQARAALVLARAHADSYANEEMTARSDIDRQLVETADPRLDEFAFQVRQIRDNTVNTRLGFWLEGGTATKDDRFVTSPRLRSNHDVLTTVRAALSEAIAKCHAMQRQALSSDEVAQALGNLNVELAPVLAAIDCNPPTLTLADNEPGPPLAWGARTRWVVDAVPIIDKPEPKYIPTERDLAMSKRRAALDRAAR